MKTPQNQNSDPSESQSDWVKTPTANLIRYKPSGIYFARVRIKGKLFRASLDTTSITVARTKLPDFVKEKRDELGDCANVRCGKMTFGDALQIFRQRLDGQQDISEGAKVYRRKCIVALLSSWPDLETTRVSHITKDACLEWSAKFANDYSATVYNNTVGTLRMVLDVAIEKGARANNPAKHIGKKRIVQRHLELPSTDQFDAFVTAVDKAGGGFSHKCADLVRFLAYGGFRKTEAENIRWYDCDFTRGLIHVRVTKNGTPRHVPMIPDMKRFLEEIKAERPDAKPEDPVMLVNECQRAIDTAVKKVPGMKRITHHDLRHLFATRCIESGVDIPTISRWLGHKDGGVLAVKTYGHLRDQHSAQMAQRVTFTATEPTNVLPMPQAAAGAS